MSNVFVFRPGATPLVPNVFDNWLSLMNAMSQVEGRKILEFDDSRGLVEIPAGRWPMRDVVWAGFGPRQGTIRTRVDILEGATFTDLRMIGGQITVVNKATSISPVSDFSNIGRGDHVQIGLRDDGGNPQLVNQGKVALFDLGTHSASFFIQNCLFGLPTPGIDSTFPLIRHSSPSTLAINILGQNQTGPNVVRSEAGATVVFGALSSSAQVAADQTEITNHGNIVFGPLGRIQRQVLPLPPYFPPATSSQGPSDGLTKPNVLIRCDGSGVGFTQVLPKIIGGFTVGNLPIPLYSGGQEVVVAEVVGGLNLSVSPSAGDTIDGYTGLVYITGHGSRTFVSDGYSNWITTSIVARRGAKPPFHQDPNLWTW